MRGSAQSIPIAPRRLIAMSAYCPLWRHIAKPSAARNVRGHPRPRVSERRCRGAPERRVEVTRPHRYVATNTLVAEGEGAAAVVSKTTARYRCPATRPLSRQCRFTLRQDFVVPSSRDV